MCSTVVAVTLPGCPPSAFVRRLLLLATLSTLLWSAEPQPRAAGGRGPELRSRVTQALEETQRAVAADPTNGQLWWNLGTQAQIAAGGSVSEETAAVALLERALLLAPGLLASYDNAMAIGDMHRGVRNASRARHFYAVASMHLPALSTHYVYGGLTYELEGDFAMAARSFLLASRIQADHTQKACAQLGDVQRFAAVCWPSHRGSSYLSYLTAALLKAGSVREARRIYSLVLGLPSQGSLESELAPQVIANAASGELLSLHPHVPGPFSSHPRLAEQVRADAAAVQATLRQHQFPAQCPGQRKLLYAYSQAFGFGAHAHMLSLALNIAVATNRVLVPVDEENWWLVNQHECGRAGFSCFFHDLTHCSVLPEERRSAVPMLQLGAAALSSDGGPHNVLFDWEGQTMAIKMGLLRDYVPQVPGQARVHGAAWWRGQLLRFLMQPRAWLAEEIRRRKQHMRWEQPVVGLHIRHGDKLKEANRLSVHDYLRVVLPAARAKGAKTLFVSTDSPDIIAELDAAAPRYRAWLRVVYEKDEIRGTDITNANLQNNLRLNVTRYTSEAARGVLLLADTSLLLCTFSSNFGRLAYELLLASPPTPTTVPPDPPALGSVDTPGIDSNNSQSDEIATRLQGVAAVSLDLPWFAYP